MDSKLIQNNLSGLQSLLSLARAVAEEERDATLHASAVEQLATLSASLH